MCGIAGIVDFGGGIIQEDRLLRMCQAIRHRGPDDQGIVILPASGEPAKAGAACAALGSRRLSIIDVRGGRQPIANEDKTVFTVLNGEIYNFQELRSALIAQGHRFATDSDTEVIVHLYEEVGEEFVEKLEGMFALALWDDRRQRLILARDRFGKKPLLYAQDQGRLLFGSEFQALLVDPSIPREIDPEALDYYLSFLAIPAPWTIYKAIRKLPPGHLLIQDRQGTAVRSYWRLSYAPKWRLSEEEAGERLIELLTQAVRKRLISEVPLGAMLSGGVDSSAVVGLMSRVSSEPVQTFSIGFEEEAFNELPHARRVASAFGCEHHEMMVRPNAVEVLPILVRHFGEPFADSSAIPSYYLAKFMREHVTVALNGDGGDEAFAGYGRHLANRLAQGWRGVPPAVRKPIDWLAQGLLPANHRPHKWGSKLRRFLAAAALPPAGRYRFWAGILTPEQKAAVWASSNGFSPEGAIVRSLFDDLRALDPVDSMLAADTAFYLPTDLLVKMDIATMANSLEARSPFLDHSLVEFIARLPSRLKLKGFTSKYLLKKVLLSKGLVPRGNLTRTKWGFAVPIGQWFRGQLRQFLGDHLSGAEICREGLLRQPEVDKWVNAHLSGRQDLAHPLWALLMLELWFRQFMRAQPSDVLK